MLIGTEIPFWLGNIESQKHSNLDKVLENIYNLVDSLKDIKWLSPTKTSYFSSSQ